MFCTRAAYSKLGTLAVRQCSSSWGTSLRFPQRQTAVTPRSLARTTARRWNSKQGQISKAKQDVNNGSAAAEESTTFLQRFLAPKVMPERNTPRWYLEMTLICTVFAITGSSTMVLVRPAVSDVLGLRGTMKDGPWSYRIASLVIMTPLYAAMLVCVGTVFGRHAYFRHFSVKMFSRFGIPPELLDKNWKVHAKNFRKW